MSQNPDALAGKSVLITGGARRIGAAIARCLHDAGMNIVIHYRNSADAAESLRDTLNHERAGSASLCAGDLVSAVDCETLSESAFRAFGRLDALVNNASAFFPTPIGTTTEAQWEMLISANLKAPFFLAQACANALRTYRGAIVNLTDIYAERPLAAHPVYCASKAGLLSLTRSLARELGPEIRVNAVAPGAILWPEGEEDLAVQEKILKRTPLKRRGDPQDIAATVRFLLQDAGFITGQVINVDGGRTALP